MARIIALLMLAVMLTLAVACGSKDPYENYNRSINRANEGFQELDRSTR